LADIDDMGRFIGIFQLVIILSVGSWGFLSSAQEDSPEVSNKAYWICKNKKEVRTIRVIVDSKTKECTTLYSKSGSEKEVGSGKWQESCVNFLTNIRTNLEKSNWTCRDISSTQITSVTE
jgi:hypothetical protein